MGSFDKEPFEKRQMKLFALVLPALAFAEDSPNDGAKKFSATVQFAWNEISGSSSWTFDTFVKRIQNYGCHCFPSAGRMPGGSGAPVDAIDEACRNLARCHSCVASDHGFVGRISQEKYRYDLSSGSIDCSANSDQQKLEQCQCDKKFAEDLGSSWNDANWDIQQWQTDKNNQKLDYAATGVCSTNGSGQLQDACCGANPDRRPYSSASFECCQDGSIASIGSC